MEPNNFKNSELWKKYGELFVLEQIPAKTILLKEGQFANKFYFIEKGCLRLWFNNNGKDITFQFFFEGDSVSSIESFRTEKSSLFSIESIESSIIYSVSRLDFQFIIQNSPDFKNKIEEQIFARLLLYQRLFLSRIKNNPKLRYIELLEQYPKIVQRVPQHYIASHLGITSVSLSRIKNRG